MSRTALLWLLWTGLTIPVGMVVAAVILYGGDRGFLLIGRSTDAHHQIELACDACHLRPFGGRTALQEACVSCHGAALKVANDSHPLSKFTDPRNAAHVALLDARECVTCHQEHRPGITRTMAVTLPDDFCVTCHLGIGEERPSHKGLAFTTCASAGCHNFHDNRALYADFLRKHGDGPAHLSVQRLMLASRADTSATKQGPETARPLATGDADAPAVHFGSVALRADWVADAHAKAGVNCSGCHTVKSAPAAWIEKPGIETCRTCHADEARTFTEGRHGMRLREGLVVARGGVFDPFTRAPLGPMTPAEARLPMKPGAHHEKLVCTACHGAHAFDVVRAKVEACLGCHDDAHSRAYRGSPHHELFRKEIAGELPAGSGVSCASCHMPRVEIRRDDGTAHAFPTHDQNDVLRPNEKMIRTVCGDCHGLQFTLDALADPELVRRNFSGHPTVRIPSLDWLRRRKASDDAKKQ